MKLLPLIIATACLNCLYNSVLAEQSTIAADTEAKTKIPDEYAHILSLDPQFLEGDRSQWQWRISAENSGPPQSNDWMFWLDLSNNDIDGKGAALWLSANLIDTRYDYELYASYSSPFAISQSHKSRVQWNWQLQLFYDYFDAGFYNALSDYDETSWYGEFGISREVNDRQNNWLLYANLRYQSINRTGYTTVDDGRINVNSEQALLVTVLGASWFTQRRRWYWQWDLRYLQNISSVEGDDPYAIDRLGRIDAGFKFRQLELYGEWSLQITEDPYQISRLQHHLHWRLAATHSFGDRLPAQVQWIVGGIDSVRAYDDSLLAADNAVFLRSEYRLEYLDNQQLPFLQSWLRQRVYLFLDMAYVTTEEGSLAIESSELYLSDPGESYSLRSVGVGFFLHFLHDISLSLESGWVLAEIAGLADPGDQRFHAHISWEF